MDSTEGKKLVAELSNLAARRSKLHQRKAEIASELAELDLELASVEGETSRIFKNIATGSVELHTARKKRTPPRHPIQRPLNDELAVRVARDLQKLHLA